MGIVSAAFPACSVFNFFQEQILLEKKIPDQNLDQNLSVNLFAPQIGTSFPFQTEDIF